MSATYRRLRAEGYTASSALHIARALDAAEWRDVFDRHVLAVARIGDAEIVAYSDDEPYDWGDIEPTDRERERLEVIGVGVRIAGESDDLATVWSVGYLSGDFQREAIMFAVDAGYLDLAASEIANRADAAARDIVTVES
jgi:hypothetical protein